MVWFAVFLICAAAVAYFAIRFVVDLAMVGITGVDLVLSALCSAARRRDRA